ncbi:asparagine synthase (glutamine-hydrolyzing) [Shivajiella indica]|uniref:asparagine synthase (glutamine-hydrolyzing) n=1 Tax=Shivajiella indica TaxID=872115 RepID=A0ABW5BA54_9BACT
MCGIVSFIDFNKTISKAKLDSATDTMVLRGPEARGTFIIEEENFNIGFGHRRLAILDLDPRSNQPLQMDNLIIVFNGEIYNFKEIRKELEGKGYLFKTESDTEVILQSYKEWGDECVGKFIGMFAFVIYNKEKKRAIITRDRIGVKPLYYYLDSQKLLVASEIKAIIPLLGEKPEIEESSLFGFFSLGYVPGQQSIFKGIKKVFPGSIINIDLSLDLQISEKIFWDIAKVETNSVPNEAKNDELSKLLEDAIRLRLIADVEVGSFLSGGLDSSYVTKVLHEKSDKEKLKTFTIGFNEKFDEAPHAKAVADYIGTEHFSYYLEPRDVRDIIINYATYFDEPFSDDAAIPMLFLSRKAKTDVKVVISSDGGDEVFAGYLRYSNTLNVFDKLNKVPYSVLLLAKYLSSFVFRILPKRNKLSNSIWRFSCIIDSDKSKLLSNIFLYGDMIPTTELKAVLNKQLFKKPFEHNYFNIKKKLTPLKQLLFIDTHERLVNQMLVKVDKSTMGASIEGREPLLDHRLFEFMSSLNDEDLINNEETKFLFRQVINKKFTYTNILNKPKMGFNTPIYDWLRFSFPDFVEEQFKSVDTLSIPYLNQKELLTIWMNFKEGKVYYQNLVWRALVYILWYKEYCLKTLN